MKQSLNEQFLRMQKLAGLLTESQYRTLVNEDLSQEVQTLIDKNGKVEATPSDMIEGNEYVLLFSDKAAKHIIERHFDGNKPGSLFKSGINLKDIAKEIINTTPTTTDGGRVKWLSANVENVGEMGVAKTTPEEVAKMKDYTMPDGARETVKILGGKRKPTSEVSLITFDLGTLKDGRKVLSIATMFPGGMEVDGAKIPMDRNEFASEGFYFVVDPSSPLLK